MKKALITGITGQDGAYLAEYLLSLGYQVHGFLRKGSLPNTDRIAHLCHSDAIILHNGDMTDGGSISNVVRIVQPDEVYNLAAQSHVKFSFSAPEYTADADALGTLRLLEAMRLHGLAGRSRFYQASTSELFGNASEVPQRETTPFAPRSPYAVAKLYAYWITANYREAYGIYACNGILFNHESPRRGEFFATRKISRSVARIKLGLQDSLALGNLDAKRDWGYAGDYVRAMWLMLQQPKPDDYVIATGETHSVREFVELAFRHVGIDIVWRGAGVAEKGHDASGGRVLVTIDPRFFRPTEVDLLLGDPAKARERLGWQPEVTFSALVRMMVDADLRLAERDALCRTGGYPVQDCVE